MTTGNRDRRARWLYVSGVVVCVAAGLLVFFLARSRRQAEAAERQQRTQLNAAGPFVRVAKAKPAAPTRNITLPGDVRPYRQSTLYAKISGYLKKIRVDRGDRVKEGHVLAVVAAPETDQQLAPLEAQLASRRQIAGRLRALVPQGVASKQELDQADAQVHGAQAEVDRLRTIRGFDTIRAPFDGTIITRYVDPGALLPAATGSTQNAQPLVDITDMSRVRITVYLGQLEAPLVKEGDDAIVTKDADPTHPIPAKVTRLSRSLDPRTRTMPVEIELPNEGVGLYPGLFVHVTLTVAASPGLIIPAEAVFLRGAKPAVAVVSGGRAHFADVEVTDDDGKQVRVVRGLKEGDLVVAQVGDEISDGAAVQVAPEGK